MRAASRGRLEGLAEAAWAQDQPRRAARLFGAAAALRDTIGFALFPTERVEQERTLAALRARLDTEAFAAALSEGRAMPLEEAIDYALGPAEPAAAPTVQPAAPDRGGPPRRLLVGASARWRSCSRGGSRIVRSPTS